MRKRRASESRIAKLDPSEQARPGSNELAEHGDHEQTDGCACLSCSFFAAPIQAEGSVEEPAADEDSDPPEQLRRELPAGVYWTFAIALLGLLLNGSMLLYHKVWMPVPVDLTADP